MEEGIEDLRMFLPEVAKQFSKSQSGRIQNTIGATLNIRGSNKPFLLGE